MLLQQPATGSWEQRAITIQNNPEQLYINSFGEDANGELYVLGQNSIGPRKAGKLYQLVFQ